MSRGRWDSEHLTIILSLRGVLSELSIACTGTVPESTGSFVGSVKVCREEMEPTR